MIQQIRRTYRFCSSHHLARAEWSDAENLRVFGPAAHPSGHGHNYRLTLLVEGGRDPLTERLVDLDALDRLVNTEILEPFDHRNLNVDVPSLRGKVPTAELLAAEIYRRLAGKLPNGRLVQVELRQDEFFTAICGEAHDHPGRSYRGTS